MQAVILSGGEGTRLRPLTSTVPKPSVPLVNRPMISYMIAWLARHGVTNVVLSCGFMAYGLRMALEEHDNLGVHLRFIEEPSPLGTAGAVKLAEDLLEERFLVLNGDVLCDFDLTAEIAQHEKSGARATLALVPVEDPTAYGVVLTDSENRVEAFLEKPDAADAPADPRINAGCYVLEREVLGSIVKGQNCSFEHDVFPQMVGKGLHAFQADGYWIDLGTPERYMQATDDLLDNKVESWVSERLSAGGRAIEPGVSTEGVTIHAPVVIDDGCELGAGAVIGPYAVLGHGCIVGAGTRIEHAVAQRGSTIGKNVVLDHSVVGPGVELGDEVVVGEASVIGEGARVGAGNTIKGASRIDAGVDIPASTVGV